MSEGRGGVIRLETKSGQDYLGRTVILTTGTSLDREDHHGRKGIHGRSGRGSLRPRKYRGR